jgi:endonuclease-3 related protein
VEVENPARALMEIYRALESDHGRLAWWPGRTRLEIIVGAILTQNTSWRNVEKAIATLRTRRMLSIPSLTRVSERTLAHTIRPSGYFRQKARKIKEFLCHLETRYAGRLDRMARVPVGPLRNELLGIWGIGPETADSILLYAFGRPVFVVDTYTHRLVRRHGLHPGGGYEELRSFFERHLGASAELYNDFHAQIVWVGKRFCGVIPKCRECPLAALLPEGGPCGDPPGHGKRRGRRVH